MSAYECEPLLREALMAHVLSHAQVASMWREPQITEVIQLARSHERLRMELEGAMEVLTDTQNGIASALTLLDDLAEVWGDEGVFRTARERLRKLIPQPTGDSNQ